MRRISKILYENITYFLEYNYGNYSKIQMHLNWLHYDAISIDFQIDLSIWEKSPPMCRSNE